MNEKTNTNTLSLLLHHIEQIRSVAHMVRTWTRKKTAEEELADLHSRYLNHPARLQMVRFEQRIKAIRYGIEKPVTKQEKEWEAYPRPYFYNELIREYTRRGLEHDVERLLEEMNKGKKVTKDEKDEQGNLLWSETNAESKELPIRQIDLSIKRR